MQPPIYEGVLEELLTGHPELAKQRVRLTALENIEMPKNAAPDGMIRFGMFPELQALTEDDFKSVEWRSQETSAAASLRRFTLFR